ncbi:beta-N-acetylhexosaminidase [Acuticoccus sp. MNP-M23]|uniref:beta-N-acetylhexosaminidase n=1 Tax=Acuticoccus sp. MNP-M23 TaxID=3072793 RepID=UPI002814A2F4|nr:beta-N-acetylhexosaminidase [Acuticoccus sp. MNP-M23]WMS42420.1 beta-N-acetylhexosaminidase [Acuticoccus sp. MNP-M23]
MAPLIVGLSGTRLTAREADYLSSVRPLGLILFARNIETGPQVTQLVADAVAASGAGLVFVDQEGGRVQRIRPPLAPRYPAGAVIGALYLRDAAAGLRAAWLAGRLISADLLPLGLNAPCLPVADVPVPGAHDIIGDRAYGTAPDVVAALAGAAAEGVLAAGALPVLKHIPGHGRAGVDSHVALPRVDADRAALQADFAPFRALSHLPMAMSAHVLYTALDPAAPATLSPSVIRLIREDIGFDGLLMTDDISMGALGGSIADNAAAALSAGCDCVLHCNGRMDEMERIASALPPISAEAARRVVRVDEARRPLPADDVAALRREFEALVGAAA